MKAPDKIYLQVCGECTEEDCKNCKFEDLEDNVTWCKDRIYKKDIEYIRKDALLEWAKNMKRICKGAEPIEKVYQKLIDKLNSL